MHARRGLVCLVVLVCLATRMGEPAHGQDARILELEKRVKELESANKGAPATRADVPGLAATGFRDGFLLRSADQQHQLRVTGQIQADYRTYLRQPDFSDLDTFLIRRARLGIEANVFGNYEFRFLPDWGNGRSTIQDAFMNVRYWDEAQFQVGKFKEPVSFEQLIQDRFVPTLERSLIDQIVPARDVGAMIHGQKLFNGQVDYALGVFNGQPNGDIDTNKVRDFAGRIAWRPFLHEFLPEMLHPLQIGISATAGAEQEPINFNGSNAPNVIRTPGNIPWLTFNSNVRADGIRTRTTPEISYIFGSFGCAAQFLRMDQNMRSGVADPVQNVRFEGYYFLATYLVTGEERTTYSQAIRPLRPFDAMHPLQNPGGWELVARLSHLQVDSSIFRAGPMYNLADSNVSSDSATELTLGFNWYLNALVRMQCNWEHTWYRQPIRLGGPDAYFTQTDAVLMRLQIIF